MAEAQPNRNRVLREAAEDTEEQILSADHADQRADWQRRNQTGTGFYRRFGTDPNVTDPGLRVRIPNLWQSVPIRD